MPSRKQFDDAPLSDESSDVQPESVGEGKRNPLTVTIPERLAERARDVAYHEGSTTVSGLVEEGLRRVLDEKDDVPPRPEGEELPSGPPPSES
jgi:hypothetical protein